MNDHLEGISVDSLRRYRDEQLQKGQFGPAETTQQVIDQKLDEPDATAALSAGRDERLHAPIDDLDELEKRQSRAEYCGFDRLASDYADRIAELQPDEEPSEAALEEQTRAALAEPDAETREHAAAALGADDAVKSTERDQEPAQYLFDRYGIDPREYDNEYDLRRAVRNADPQRLDDGDDGVSKERAALGISDRADLDQGGQTAAGLIRDRYGLDPEDYESAEALRDAIVAQGGYKSGATDTSDTTFSALSANRNRQNGSGD